MKVITPNEANAGLSRDGRLWHEEPVIATVNGVPSIQLVPLELGDDLINRLLEHNPKVRPTLESRGREPSLSPEDAEKLLK
jgi:hypothetical protein